MYYTNDSMTIACYNISMSETTKVTRGSHAQVRKEKLEKWELEQPEKSVQALPADLNLTGEKKRDFYLSLASLNYIEAAKQIGLGARYRTDSSLRAIGYRLFNTINPDELGISKDAQTIVRNAITNRKVKSHELMNSNERSIMADVLDPDDTRKLIDGAKNKAVLALNKKFDYMLNSKKQLEDVSLSQLATAFGIVFDKSQILRGEATENVAIMAKIKTDMTPDEALKSLLNIREVQQEEKVAANDKK